MHLTLFFFSDAEFVTKLPHASTLSGALPPQNGTWPQGHQNCVIGPAWSPSKKTHQDEQYKSFGVDDSKQSFLRERQDDSSSKYSIKYTHLNFLCMFSRFRLCFMPKHPWQNAWMQKKYINIRCLWANNHISKEDGVPQAIWTWRMWVFNEGRFSSCLYPSFICASE